MFIFKLCFVFLQKQLLQKIMIKKTFFFNFSIIIFSFLLLISCSNDTEIASENEFIIKAKFENSKGEKIYLFELNVNDKVLLDSAFIDENGEISIKRKIEEPGFYILHESGNNFINLVIDKGETILIKADIRSLAKTYEVEGSENSKLLYQYELFTSKNNKKVDVLSQAYENNKHNPRFIEIKDSLDQEFTKILNEQKKTVKDFLKKNNTSLASLIVINRRFREHVVVSENDDFIYFDMLDKTLTKLYPTNKHTIDNHLRTEIIRKEKEEESLANIRLAKGKKIPFFSMFSINGDTVNSDEFKNKYCIIYFWASFNASSRLLNQQLISIYKKYKKQNLQIIGISLDTNPDYHKAAIKIDKTEWLQLNDFLGWDSPVVYDYYIKKLPKIFLIDNNSCIVGNNLKYNELNQLLNQIFD